MYPRIAKFIIAIAFIGLTHPVSGAETVVAEEACSIEGYQRSLRQTVVVIDQLAIDPWLSGEMSENNRRWINAVVSIAGVQDGQRNSYAAPRERLTILIARTSGSDLVRVFTGCSPTFSRDELDQMGASSSGVGRKFEEWLGKDPKSRVEANQKAFRNKLLGALVQLTKEPLKSKPASSDFLALLPEIGRSFDVANGVPRVIIFSPLAIGNSSFTNKKSAREMGFQQAMRAPADLKRAEVYIVRGKSEIQSFTRDYVDALLLGSKGHLVDASGETLPTLQEAPQMVAIYGGFISYGLIKAPMQIRLAVDSTGTLVNSWVEISVDKAVATPMTGKAICKGASFDSCKVKGDGKEFSQVWAPDPDPNKPTFDQKLPFSGIRWFEFDSQTTGISGKFSDPMVIVNKQKEMPFELSVTPHIKF